VCRAVLTFLADIVSFQVGEEVLLARLQQVHGVVWDGDGAVAAAGAAPVQMLEHIRPAADLVLGRQTLAARTDASVASCRHDDHRVAGTAGVERVGKTILAQLCTTSQHAQQCRNCAIKEFQILTILHAKKFWRTLLVHRVLYTVCKHGPVY